MRHTYLHGLSLLLAVAGAAASGCNDSSPLDVGSLPASGGTTASSAGSAATTGGTTSTQPGNGGATNPGNGGTTSGTTGGTTSSATGGATNPGNGGTTSSATGGTTSSATGGTTSSTTGGATSSATGGATSSATGGAMSSATGGTTSSTTGGATSSSSGGTSSTAGASSGTAVQSWNFDTSVQSWAVSWGDPTTMQTGSTVTWDAAVGDPALGSLAVSAPFAALSQKVQIQVSLLPGATDLSGKTITARIKLDTGLTTDVANPAGAMVYAKSGTGWLYASGLWTNIVGTTWFTISMTVSTPTGYVTPGFDPTQVMGIGIEIATSATATAVTAATLHIDSVSY